MENSSVRWVAFTAYQLWFWGVWKSINFDLISTYIESYLIIFNSQISQISVMDVYRQSVNVDHKTVRYGTFDICKFVTQQLSSIISEFYMTMIANKTISKVHLFFYFIVMWIICWIKETMVVENLSMDCMALWVKTKIYQNHRKQLIITSLVRVGYSLIPRPIISVFFNRILSLDSNSITSYHRWKRTSQSRYILFYCKWLHNPSWH